MSMIVRFSKRLKCWNTIPICCLIGFKSVPGFVSSTSSSHTFPPVGLSNILRHRKNVLLPEPEGPTITIFSPSLISQEIPFKISLSPYDFFKFSTRNILAQPPFKISKKDCKKLYDHKIYDSRANKWHERLISS